MLTRAQGARLSEKYVFLLAHSAIIPINLKQPIYAFNVGLLVVHEPTCQNDLTFRVNFSAPPGRLWGGTGPPRSWGARNGNRIPSGVRINKHAIFRCWQ